MKKLFTVFVILMTSLSVFAQKDKFAGFYTGKSGKKQIFAEVFRSFDDTYRLRLYSAIIEKKGDILFEVEALTEKKGVIPASVEGKLNAVVTPTEINGEFKTEKLFLVRIDYESETMGAKPPAGAVVLFDGNDLSEHWSMGKSEPNWVIKDGSATIDNANKSTSIVTKNSYGAMKVHFEFKNPTVYNEPAQQRRGNSGIKFGPYEIQILDSFGNTVPNHYDLGAVYSIYAPTINASLEAGAWQTYDIEFTPVKYDAQGNVLALPRFTVSLNGVVVQDNVEVPSPTNAKEKLDKSFKHPEKVRLILQNHKHDNSFRNIWLVELGDK